MPDFSRALLLLAFALPLEAMGAIENFAFEATLSESTQPLQRVEIPLELMLELTRSDLGDIAIFNTEGQLLPFSIMRTPEIVNQRKLNLPFHEFSRFLRQHSKTVTTREQNQQQGQLSELQTTETIAVQKLRKDYLIELAPQENSPDFDYLELDWTHQPAEQLLQVKVEVGKELDQMRTIQKRKSLTNLESKDISWRSIRGIPRQQKYLRLSAANSITQFELKQVSGIYRQIEPAKHLVHSIDTKLIEDEQNTYYAFELPAAVLPEFIRIIPAEPHSVISGDLYASNNDFKSRQRISTGFRQHNIDDAEVKPSKPLSIAHGNYHQFRIRSRSTLSAPPRVELIYAQYEIIFLGDNNPPFSIAWGNYESQADNADLGSILELDLDQARDRSERVTLGTVLEVGGAERLAPEPELPWQKWLLWAFLMLAAVVTGRMAIKLYREMNQPASTDPET